MTWEIFWICVSVFSAGVLFGAPLGYYTRCRDEEAERLDTAEQN